MNVFSRQCSIEYISKEDGTFFESHFQMSKLWMSEFPDPGPIIVLPCQPVSPCCCKAKLKFVQDVSKFLHEFVKVVEMNYLKLSQGFVKIIKCICQVVKRISNALPNQTKLKFDLKFESRWNSFLQFNWMDSIYEKYFVTCGFGNQFPGQALFFCLFWTLFGHFSYSNSINDALTIELNYLLNWISRIFFWIE